jgi:hypothetical protein
VENIDVLVAQVKGEAYESSAEVGSNPRTCILQNVNGWRCTVGHPIAWCYETRVAAVLVKAGKATEDPGSKGKFRRFHCVQIDVFTSQRLQGNPLSVFTDARGLSDAEMQDLARETNLQETTFVFPRDAATEREHGVKVRIFVPEEEIPFGGHPTLGTAMVLRNLRLTRNKPRTPEPENVSEITLDLKVGKVPVSFREDSPGSGFGEMRQVPPVFGPVHDRNTVAALLDLKPSDLADRLAHPDHLCRPAFRHRAVQATQHIAIPASRFAQSGRLPTTPGAQLWLLRCHAGHR